MGKHRNFPRNPKLKTLWDAPSKKRRLKSVLPSRVTVSDKTNSQARLKLKRLRSLGRLPGILTLSTKANKDLLQLIPGTCASHFLCKKQTAERGLGLFVKKGMHLWPGQVIPLFYLGYVYRDAAELKDTNPKTHVISLLNDAKQRIWVDAHDLPRKSNSPMTAGLINGTPNRLKANCQLPSGMHYATPVKILKHIKQGEELIAYYGAEYNYTGFN